MLPKSFWNIKSIDIKVFFCPCQTKHAEITEPNMLRVLDKSNRPNSDR